MKSFTMSMKNMKAINLVLLLFLVACGVSRDEYVSWLQQPENGFHQQRTINELTIDVQYADSTYQQLKDKVQDPVNHVFYVRIFSTNTEKSKYLEALASQAYTYFSFEFEKDSYIEINTKKYPCNVFHYEQNHGKMGEFYFVLGFELTQDISTPIQLVLNPTPLATGPVKFTFDLSKLPNMSN